jgi:hypothetical protein
VSKPNPPRRGHVKKRHYDKRGKKWLAGMKQIEREERQGTLASQKDKGPGEREDESQNTRPPTTEGVCVTTSSGIDYTPARRDRKMQGGPGANVPIGARPEARDYPSPHSVVSG